jgi:hypothetical protein
MNMRSLYGRRVARNGSSNYSFAKSPAKEAFKETPWTRVCKAPRLTRVPIAGSMPCEPPCLAKVRDNVWNYFLVWTFRESRHS